MPSSKPKREIVCCQWCPCAIAYKDVEKHKQICKSDDPFVPGGKARMPRGLGHSFLTENTLFGLVEFVTEGKGSEHLDGWLRDHLVLLNPAAMRGLRVTFQTPCIVSAGEASTSRSSVFIVWPSDEVSTLGVGKIGKKPLQNRKARCEEIVSVTPIRGTDTCQHLELCNMGKTKSFHTTAQFDNYVRDYLKGGFLFPNKLVEIRYFGQISRFAVTSYNETKNGPCFLRKLNDSVQNLSLEESSSLWPLGNQVTQPRSISPSSEINMSFPEIRIPGVPKTETSQKCLHLTSFTDISLKYETSSQDKPIDGSFSRIGGLEGIKSTLLQYLSSDRSLVKALLLFGPSGCGKSMLLKALSYEIQTPAILLSHSQILMLDQLKMTENGSAGLVLMDDLDTTVGSQKDSVGKTSAVLCEFIDNLPLGFRCVGCVRYPERLDSALRRRFQVEIEVHVPSASERREILHKCLQNIPSSKEEEAVDQIADAAHGYTGADLATICKVAFTMSLSDDEDGKVTKSNLSEALGLVRASAMREIALEIPKVQWSDVGGQEEVKQALRQAVEWPLLHPAAFRRLGVQPPAGVLLYGPPGCSKTLIARAIATKSGLNFLAVKGPELFSKWVGESERAVRELFRRARQVGPAVIFFDEIDALAASRGAGGSPVGDRVLVQLLTELDGLESRGKVTVIAATNRPDVMDRALLRPGRLDRVLYVPLPDANTRKEILKLQLQKIPAGADVSATTLVERTNGYSGAEIVALCSEAALSAMREDLHSQCVNWSHFEYALFHLKPRTDTKLLEIYENFHRSCGGMLKNDMQL